MTVQVRTTWIRSIYRWTGGLLLIIGLAGCSNDGASLVTDFFNLGSEEISLADDVQPVFNANCALTGCHAGAVPEAGLSLEPGDIFAPSVGIVGVPSQQLPSMLRVTPGASDASYLIHKLQGTFGSVGGSGEQMPLNEQPLSSSTILRIRKWIDQGAMDN